MATTKKTTKAATAPKKKAARASHKTTSKAKKKSVFEMDTVVMPKNYQDTPFLTLRITHQTVYWLILSVFVLGLGLWVININDKVMRIYDQIDQVNAAANNYAIPKKVPQPQQ